MDNRDFQIVKTCGKNVPDIHKKDKENLTPKFVTYREQVDGEYWFPTYTRADDVLHFKSGDVHIREILKYTKYKRFGVKTRIIYKGQPIKKARSLNSKKVSCRECTRKNANQIKEMGFFIFCSDCFIRCSGVLDQLRVMVRPITYLRSGT